MPQETSVAIFLAEYLATLYFSGIIVLQPIEEHFKKICDLMMNNHDLAIYYFV
jgi:hypothetical protein